MFCLTRDKPIRLPDDDAAEDLLDEVYGESEKEKDLLPPGRASEDEMQERLADLRKQVTSAGLDW